MVNVLNRVAFVAIIFFGMTGQVKAQKESDYYKIEDIVIPKEIILECGGIAFDDKGRLFVSTRRGEVWLIKNPKSNTPTYTLFAHGMHENLGLAYKDGSFYTVQRSELTKLTDTDGDDIADKYERIAGWDLTGNYHEYSYGPEFLPNGDMLITLNVAWISGGVSTRKWRGWMIKVTPEGKVIPIAAGLRSPAGLYANEDGEMFFTENQGDWVGSGRLTHLESGDFAGHRSSLKWAQDPDSPVNLKIEDIVDKAHGGEGWSLYEYNNHFPSVKPATVWLPHGIMGNSTSDMKKIPRGFGPFAGQYLVGDQAHSKIMRVTMEKVKGVYQGACYGFREGFKSGIIRFKWFDDELYVGQTSRGWWSTGGHWFGLERLKWTGKNPFEMKDVKIKPDGFEITFTQAINKSSVKALEGFAVTDFTYLYHKTYGSPVVEKEKRIVHKIKVSEDGKKVRIYLDTIRPGFIYEIKGLDVTNQRGQKLLHNVAYYTVNRIPNGFKEKMHHHKTGQTKIIALQSAKRITKMPKGWDESELTAIEINPAPGLRFKQKLFKVKPGEKIKLTFDNTDEDMLHNLLLVDKGAVEKVVEMSMNLGLDGQQMGYIPDTDLVLYHTSLLQPNTKDTIYFEAPTEPGKYIYVCTYPGHGQFMRGVLIVEDKDLHKSSD